MVSSGCSGSPTLLRHAAQVTWQFLIANVQHQHKLACIGEKKKSTEPRSPLKVMARILSSLLLCPFAILLSFCSFWAELLRIKHTNLFSLSPGLLLLLSGSSSPEKIDYFQLQEVVNLCGCSLAKLVSPCSFWAVLLWNKHTNLFSLSSGLLLLSGTSSHKKIDYWRGSWGLQRSPWWEIKRQTGRHDDVVVSTIKCMCGFLRVLRFPHTPKTCCAGYLAILNSQCSTPA